MVATTTLMNERAALSGAGSTSGENVGGGPVDAVVAVAQQNGSVRDDTIRQRLVQALIEGRIIKMTNLRSTAARKSGKQPGPEGSITKLFQAEFNRRLQNLAVDLLGTTATAWAPGDEHAAATVRGFLRSRANTIEGGTTEVNKNILGEKVLGLPREPDPWHDRPWEEVPRS